MQNFHDYIETTDSTDVADIITKLTWGITFRVTFRLLHGFFGHINTFFGDFFTKMDTK